MFEEDHAPVTLSEIYHQAASCQRTIALAQDRSSVFNRFQPLDSYTDIILTGCGSSHHLAICASFALSEMLQRPVSSVASSELAHFPDHYFSRNARPFVIAISRSGDTTEVRLAVERLQADYVASSIALTTEGNEVAHVCDAGIVFDECVERSVVMTHAFTCMLVGLYRAGDDFSGGRRAEEIRQLPRLIADALLKTEQAVRSIAEDQSISRFFFLGSGPMKGLADECALKITEMALDTALSYRTLEFRHGPKATLNASDQVIIFPVEAEMPYIDDLVSEIARIGARVLVVAPQSIKFSDSRVSSLNICSDDNPLRGDNLLPAFYAHFGQLLAYWRAAARDLNPDAPRHLARTVLLNV